MHPAAPAPTVRSPLGARLADACQAMHGRRLPLVATAWGTGIGVYFALPAEPHAGQLAAIGAGAAALLGAAWRGRHGAGLVPLVGAVLLLGLLAGAVRTAVVAGPVLDWRYYGPVEGRVLMVDRSASDAPRVTLDRVRLDGVAAAETPERVRLSLHGGGAAPLPGQRVMTTAHLTAPNGPVEPGGFDFQRHAWFLRIGAVGYARAPLLLAAPAEPGAVVRIARMRARLSDALRSRLPGPRGEIAAAITTGDRSGLPDDLVEDLRRSNLAHLLAISGLHMGLLAGFVFWAVRAALALVPPLALRHPIRAWAAAAALPVAFGYLLLSGAGVATQRAFLMSAVVLVAVMLGRRAVSLRSVSLAAILVLAWRPEALTGPGFQMSFAATVALVLAFRALAARPEGAGRWLRGWRGAVVGVVLSSLVAGLATGPFAAAHFNRIGQYGLLANVLAVPAMGAVVMPALLAAMLAWPLGLEQAPLEAAGLGIAWIAWIAGGVADLPGSVGHVAAPGPWVLPLLGLGLALVAALPGWGRAAGAAMAAAGFILWAAAERPDALVSGDGRLVGVMTPQGRWLSREDGAGFAAGSWLENDGDGATQAAASRRALAPDAPPFHVLRGKTGLDAALAACRSEALWLVTPVRVDDDAGDAGRCIVFDADRLERTGAVAVHLGGEGGPRFVHAADVQGLRPWTRSWRMGRGQ